MRRSRIYSFSSLRECRCILSIRNNTVRTSPCPRDLCGIVFSECWKTKTNMRVEMDVVFFYYFFPFFLHRQRRSVLVRSFSFSSKAFSRFGNYVDCCLGYILQVRDSLMYCDPGRKAHHVVLIRSVNKERKEKSHVS